MRAPRPRIDWEALKQRLAENARRLEGAARSDADALRRTFQRRAARLTARSRCDRKPADALTLMRVRVGRERCAIELSELSGIVPLRGYTPVPGTDAAVLGVMSARGELHAVIDPVRWVRAPEDDAEREDHRGYVVLLRRGRDALGLYVHDAEQIISVNRDELQRPEEDGRVLPLRFVKALMPDGAAILDIEAILAATVDASAEAGSASIAGAAEPWGEAA